MQKLKVQLKNQSFLFPILIVIVAAFMRLVPHPANVAPITAMALFGGVYFNKKYALLIPLLALFISDLFLGFHDTMIFVYLSFLITGIVGICIKQLKSKRVVILASIFSSVQFFIITNFGVWLVGRLYPKTFDGLMQAYIMGLPFFRNTLFGDLLYVGIFFGAFTLLMHYSRIKSLAAS